MLPVTTYVRPFQMSVQMFENLVREGGLPLKSLLTYKLFCTNCYSQSGGQKLLNTEYTKIFGQLNQLKRTEYLCQIYDNSLCVP